MLPFFGAACLIIIFVQDLSWSQPTGEMLEFIKKDKTTDEEDGAFLFAVTQWAEKDLSAAHKWAYALKRDNAKDEKLYSYATMGVMDAVAKKGVKTSFEWVKTLSTSEERSDAVLLVSGSFKDTSSLEIAEAGLILESGSAEQVCVGNLFVSASAKEVPELIKFAQKIDNEEYKNAIIDSCFFAINEKDPEEAIKIWEALPNDREKDQLFRRYFAQSVENKPPIEALEWLKVHTFDGFNKERTRDNIMQKWTDSDPDAAGEHVLKEFGNNPEALQILNYTETLSKQWPDKVFPWLKKLPNSEKETFYANRFAEELRKQNPKLFDKIKKETEDPVIIKALDHASFSEASDKGPQEACKMYMELDQKAKKDLQVEYLFSCLKWHEANPVEFMRWARSLRKEEFDSINLFLQATSKKFDSQERKTYIADEMALGPKRDSAIVAIAQKKVSDDPKEAALWAQQLPLDNARVEAIDAVAMSWSLKNPSDACDWLIFISDTLPDNSNTLCFPFVTLSDTDPLLALQKAMKLKTSEARNTIITIVAFGLAEKDPGQLKLQIKGTKDPEDRNFLLSILLGSSLENPESCKKTADWLLEIEPCPFQRKETNYFFYLFEAWGKADRNSCLEWVRSAPTKDSDQAVLKSVVIANLLAGDDPFFSSKIQPSINGTGHPLNEIQNKKSSSGTKTVSPQEKIKVARKDNDSWFARILYREVRGDRASNIMLSVLAALTLFNGFKIWKLSRASFIPKSVRVGVGILSFIFLMSLPPSIYPLFSKENILTRLQVIYLGSYCFSAILITACFQVIANQAARGSRVLLVIGVLLTLLGVVGVPVALFKSGNLPYALSCLLYGVPILICALRKTSREYRVQARSKKTQIPKLLFFSILCHIGFSAFYMIKDVLHLLETNRTLALQLAWMCALGIVLYIGTILWALRWGDKVAFNLYRLFLTCVAVYVISLLFASFPNPSLIRTIINVVLAILYLIPAVLVFLPSVRNWAKNLKPAF